ncbi:MAG TPA: hypothetical protein VJ242_01410 [Patescibacteria group bacterium]|nr:hypothetical protein [Patescibacteria group bacterium]
MGDGSASGIVSRPQKFAHLMLDKESWPNISDKVLALSPEKLQKSADRLHQSLRLENNSIFPDQRRITQLENAIHVCDLAQTIQSRQRDFDQAKTRDPWIRNVEEYYNSRFSRR